MIKVRKAYVFVMAGLLASLFVVSASAAFGFSSPFTTIVAGPGLSAVGPTTFNTYYHDGTMASSAAQADAAVNGFGAGGFSPIPGCLPGIPFGLGGWGPAGVANAANSMAANNWAEDNTFATSFSTAGGATGLPLGACNFAGTFPEFTLNLF
ncbi:MAG: hypothetical protein A4E28_01950 [Methanocella sp. PtaU1.Bin125]|nr:MAG: hypothetical protein A4E28_01950 [Methanocella sp. PtaU1.Bin125]